MRTYYLLALVLILSIALPEKTSAQFYYGARNNAQALDMMFNPYKYRLCDVALIGGALFPSSELTYYIKDGNGRQLERTAFGKGNVMSFVGLSMGNSFRIAKFENNKALGIYFNGMVLYGKTSISDKNFDKKGIPTFSREVVYYSMLVPFGLDYKIGAEAAEDRYLKTMFTIGAGGSASLNLDDAGYGDFNLSPYVKVEAGYFVGIAMKVRLVYYHGEHNITEGYVVDEDPLAIYDPNNKQSLYKLSSSGRFMLSLVLMPWSRTWD